MSFMSKKSLTKSLDNVRKHFVSLFRHKVPLHKKYEN